MKAVGVREAKDGFTACLEESQSTELVITRHGKPVAALIGVEGLDLEQVMLGMDEDFWSMLAERRRKDRRFPTARGNDASGCERAALATSSPAVTLTE
jgi:prevent-host-death family protein